MIKYIKNHFKNYCLSIFRNSGKRTYWSINNSAEINVSKQLGNKKLYIGDFSNLFTSLPHTIITKNVTAIIGICFKNSGKSHISIKNNYITYCSQNTEHSYSQDDIKFMLQYILDNSFCCYKNQIYKQSKGVPQGNNASPLIADLTLTYSEYDYLLNCEDIITDGYRYVDDVTIFYKEDLNIENVMTKMYPNQLILQKSNVNNHEGDFLDLNISKTDKNAYKSNLFNKTSNFKFKVIRMQNFDSNVSFSIKHACITGEIIRLSRCCTLKEEFLENILSLFKESIIRGYKLNLLIRLLEKTLHKNTLILLKYEIQHNSITKLGRNIKNKLFPLNL